MEDLRVGRRYALALFETAHKFDVIASVEEDLNAIVALLERDDEFTSFLVSPYTSRDEKLQIIDKLFSDRITALTMQLLRLMLEKRRETDIIHVRAAYGQLGFELRVMRPKAKLHAAIWHEIFHPFEQRVDMGLSQPIGVKTL